MIYCISDIHGEYDRYLAMLGLIDFSDQDHLYVLGDVIDRKPGGIDILMDIMSRGNVTLLLGNHEEMMLATLGSNNIAGARQLWQQNGGSCTYRDLLYHRTQTERKAILQFVQALPDHLDIEVGGRKFHLVHAYPGSTREVRLWERPAPDTPAPLPGTTVIIGHTPTCFLNGDDLLDPTPFRIWYGDGIIDIDCGCGNQTGKRRLACLRLDDMAEFYT